MKALDGDTLSGKAMTFGVAIGFFLVATENVKHFSRYVHCAD